MQAQPQLPVAKAKPVAKSVAKAVAKRAPKRLPPPPDSDSESSESSEEELNRDDMETMHLSYLVQRKNQQMQKRRSMWAQLAGLS